MFANALEKGVSGYLASIQEADALSAIRLTLLAAATMPLYVEILYNDYQFVPAFAVASLLTLLALVTLVAKSLVEWKSDRQLAALSCSADLAVRSAAFHAAAEEKS